MGGLFGAGSIDKAWKKEKGCIMPTRTKIIVTLGPSSANEEVLRQLIDVR